MKVSDVLPAVVERIVSLFAPERIMLFGPQARGVALPDSDLDLIVVMDNDRHRAAWDIRVSLADVLVPMDIIVTTPGELVCRGQMNGSFFRPALEEGKVQYDLSWHHCGSEDLGPGDRPGSRRVQALPARPVVQPCLVAR